MGNPYSIRVNLCGFFFCQFLLPKLKLVLGNQISSNFTRKSDVSRILRKKRKLLLQRRREREAAISENYEAKFLHNGNPLIIDTLLQICHFLKINYILFRIYDMDNDGFVSNGELFQVLKMMVGNNLKDSQLQQIVDKTIIMYDKVGCLIL